MDIEAHDLRVVIDGRTIVEDVSLVCRPGTSTALVGPSGSGKTTLLHCLGLLQAPTSGRVLVDAVDTTSWRGSKRRRFWQDHAAFVLQDYGVIEEETVAFNVMMMPATRRRGPDSLQRMRAALVRTGLDDRESEPAARLSGGEKQRLAIARALYKKAEVVYVDEPTASLDATNRHRVVELFVSMTRAGCTVIVSTHDDEMINACDRIYSLAKAPGTRRHLVPSGSAAGG